MFGIGKHRLSEDLFRGACDVHCHLLPGVDDGFPTTEKSLQALKKLEERGVQKMILTPHFMKQRKAAPEAAAIAPPIAEVMWSYPGAISVTRGPKT